MDSTYDTVLFARGGDCGNNRLLAQQDAFLGQACDDDAACNGGVCVDGFCAEPLGLCNDDARIFADSILCRDAFSCGTRSALEFDVVEGESYFIFVDGYSGFGGGARGEYVLSSIWGPCDDAAAPPRCTDDIHCPNSYVCRDNACEFFCENDAACGNRQICNEGACQDVECREDADCAAGVPRQRVCPLR